MKDNIKNLRNAQESLTKKYKQQHKTGQLTAAEHKVYLEARMPAIESACRQVFSHIIDKEQITTILDLGCGPGTATFAAIKKLPNLKIAHLIDQDNWYDYKFNINYEFFNTALENLVLNQQYDLTVISYVLNECAENLIKKVLTHAWEKTKNYLIILEPGTPHGYHSFLRSRDILIGQGAYLIAPCPHEQECPLKNPDWCHFKTRIQRTNLHKNIKAGSKAFEDESYIYGIFSKRPPSIREDRIIKKPRKRSHHILFEFCTTDGIKQKIVSYKNKDTYYKAKKWEWGDGVILTNED